MTPTGFQVLFLILMISGLPVALGMVVSSLVYIMSTRITPDYLIIHRLVTGIDSFPLLAIPFFIMAGNMMNSSGVTTRIYNFAMALVGWAKGGLGHVNVIGSVIFAGMSGTAVADAAGLGTVEIKAMNDAGYDIEFSVGVTAASATLGPIIPPSVPFVIYGMVANVSVADLFLGGILPGGVMAVLMMVTVTYYAHTRRFHPDAIFSWRRLGSTFLRGVLPLITPVLLIGGMTTGLFTATEGAIAAVVWALFLGVVVYRTLTLRSLVKVSMETIETTSTIMLIIAASAIFSFLLTVTRTTEAVAEFILAFSDKPWVFLLLANLLMLFVGSFLDSTPATIIMVPILLPIALKLGIHPVHFGVVMVLNLMIGLLHPPMGLVLYVLSRVAKLSFERTLIAILPWLVPLLISLILVTYIPSITMFLPRLLLHH